jgi:hypothetical protein
MTALLHVILVISTIIFYIIYNTYYDELDVILLNSELSNALQSGVVANMLLILITVLCTISLNSITFAYIMRNYIKPVYNFTTLLYVLTALMTVGILIYIIIKSNTNTIYI